MLNLTTLTDAALDNLIRNSRAAIAGPLGALERREAQADHARYLAERIRRNRERDA